jgi:malonate transporter and related proteins
MSALLDVILPVFMVIGFGWIAAFSGKISESAIDGLMRFAQNFAIPVLLFKSIATLDLGQTFDLRLFASFYIGALSGFLLAAGAALWLFHRPLTDAVAIGFAGMFSNSLLLGLPITERAYGVDALTANYAIIAIHSPLLYGLGITAMELARSRGQGLSPGRLARQVVQAITRQPLVIGIACGFAVNLSGVPLPGFFWSGVDLIIRAALPAALFGLGGVLTRYRPEGDMKVIGLVVCISLVVHPALTYGIGRALDLTIDQLRSAVVTAAMAPGVNAYLFAHMYGSAKRVAASAVLIGTAATILTAWMWLHILP